MSKDAPVEAYLRKLVRTGTAGARLPTVRDLMVRFGVSQLIVQRAFRTLRSDGLIQSHVGRGTFVAQSDGDIGSWPAGRRRSKTGEGPGVLMLTRNSGSDRTVWVSSQLQKRLAKINVNSIQITYSDVDHALAAQRALPVFSACILQMHFDLVPIKLLSFMRERSRSILVDGANITGIDVDSVASDWRSAMELAIDHLIDSGHERIAFATSSFRARPIEATHQHFESLRHFAGQGQNLPPTILLDHLPGEERAEHIAEQLSHHLNSEGRLNYSALMIWGITRGEELLNALEHLSIRVPEDLSVILLGHVDIEAEHRNFFTICGSSADQTVAELITRLQRRWGEPNAGYEPKYLPARLVKRSSVARILPHSSPPV